MPLIFGHLDFLFNMVSNGQYGLDYDLDFVPVSKNRVPMPVSLPPYNLCVEFTFTLLLQVVYNAALMRSRLP